MVAKRKTNSAGPKPVRSRRGGMKIAKWGNCMAVRIPRTQADAIGLKIGDEVRVEKVAEGVLIRPVRVRPALEELVARITPSNRHGEVDTGAPVGKELV